MLNGNERRVNFVPGNSTMIDVAFECVRIKKLEKRVLMNINFVRLKKKLLLPCELVGMNGKRLAEYYVHLKESSQLDWGFFPKIEEKNKNNAEKTMGSILTVVICKGYRDK